MNKEPKYVLYVQDMFHCFEKPVRSEEYDNSIDAINSAKRKIRNSFEGRLDEGYKHWFNYGRNVWIKSENGAKEIKFSGIEYVKKICSID